MQLVGEETKSRALLATLGKGIELLWSIDLGEDQAAEGGMTEAYYQLANGLISLLVATAAQDLVGLRIKAEAVAWCCASRTDFALGDTSEALLIASMLRDLLSG